MSHHIMVLCIVSSCSLVEDGQFNFSPEGGRVKFLLVLNYRLLPIIIQNTRIQFMGQIKIFVCWRWWSIL